MKARHAVLVAIATAGTLASIAAARPLAAKQGVMITSQAAKPTSTAPFVLTPLQPGALKRDSGTESCTWKGPHIVMREGQKAEIYDPVVCTDKGSRGSLTIRSRIEWVDAGSGYHVGAGTWKVVRGTGQYAGVTGGGRSGGVWLDRGPWSGRSEGFLTLP
jgi:hypothetical protein